MVSTGAGHIPLLPKAYNICLASSSKLKKSLSTIHQGEREMAASSSPCADSRGECVEWVEKYFQDCVCDLRSEISFSLGIASLLFWGIAEIPQIISNYRTKSGHGVSIALLLTWFIGDILNLVGCRLEPATLPTQFYTALLYTAVTVVLLLQTFYYDYYVSRYWKVDGTATINARFKNVPAAADLHHHHDHEHLEAKKQPLIHRPNEAVKPLPTAIINTSNRASPRTDYYYTSARSLASSGTPSYLSYLGRVGSGPSMAAAAALHDSSSSDDDEARDKGRDSQQVPFMSSSAKPKPILISPNGGYAAFIIGSVGALPSRASALMEAHAVFLPRRLLKDTGLIALEANPYGIALGWIMAAIYMGGRVPQIFLNIKRGGVEGLNPLMFMFAIIANATYVGSILVRSVEWQRIKANAPWLFDAIVCVLLDLFIILQFAYYKFLHNGTTDHSNEEADVNVEASTEGRKTTFA